jgi:hypothetical protein
MGGSPLGQFCGPGSGMLSRCPRIGIVRCIAAGDLYRFAPFFRLLSGSLGCEQRVSFIRCENNADGAGIPRPYIPPIHPFPNQTQVRCQRR